MKKRREEVKSRPIIKVNILPAFCRRILKSEGFVGG